MLSNKVVQEIFRPQPMYSLKSTRQIFSKVAQSSNRRLDANAMQILFDLMLIGFKYQVLQMVQPEELLHITAKHLDTMEAMVIDEPAVHFVRAARNRFTTMVNSFNAYDFIVIKQMLYKLFSDNLAPVSVLHRSGVQKANGTILLDISG